MFRFLLEHQHQPDECGVVYAAFRGHASPLRRQATVASCLVGGHQIWWLVEAATDLDALRLLPPYVAERTRASRVDEVSIP
jgi:hypothetical protein